MRGWLIARGLLLALMLICVHSGACRDDSAHAEWRQNYRALCDPGVGCPRGWVCVIEDTGHPADSDSQAGISISYCMKACATRPDCKPYNDSAECIRDINGRTFVCSGP